MQHAKKTKNKKVTIRTNEKSHLIQFKTKVKK